jgi:hypothetical protein
MLAVLGIKLVGGPALRPGSLLVANHVSWLDILVLLAVAPVRLVAKGEVGRGRRSARWPAVRAIFIDRSRPKAAPTTVAEVTPRCGPAVGRGLSGGYDVLRRQQAVPPACSRRRSTPARPVVPPICYDSTAAAFIGDDTLCRLGAPGGRAASLTVTLVPRRASPGSAAPTAAAGARPRVAPGRRRYRSCR